MATVARVTTGVVQDECAKRKQSQPSPYSIGTGIKLGGAGDLPLPAGAWQSRLGAARPLALA